MPKAPSVDMPNPLCAFENGRRQAEVNLRCAGLDAFDIVLAYANNGLQPGFRVWAVAAEPDASGSRRTYLRGPKATTMDAAMVNFLQATAHLVAEAQEAQFARLEAKGVGRPLGYDSALVDKTAFRALPEYALAGPSSGLQRVEEGDLPPKYEPGPEGKLPLREK